MFKPSITATAPQRLPRLTWLLLGLASTSLIACGSSSNKPSSTQATSSHSTSAQLVRAKSDADLLKHLTDGLLNLSVRDAAITTDRPASPPNAENLASEAGDSASNPASDGGFSAINRVEAGVDEADISKFDGEFIYLAEQPDVVWGWMGPQPGERSHARIDIFRSDRATASALPVTQITLDSPGLSIDGLYLYGDRTQNDARLIGVSSSYQYGWGYWDYEPAWQGGKTRVDIWDVNDLDVIAGTTQLEWQGYHVSSRRIGDTLYVITRHTPQVDNIIFWPTDSASEMQNRQTIANVDLTSLIPTLIINGGNETTLFSSQDCLVSQKSDSRYERPSLLSITAIPLSNPTQPSTVCTTAYDGGLYASQQSIYISEYEYQADGKAFTRIHKFSVREGAAQYRASGRVEGALGWNSAAFRMSEQGDFLRVITSTWADSTPQHALTVLQDTGSNLTQVARIPNASQPAQIGKPDEDIYGVRFLGDRAYIVTFERIDPLYVIDLSAPTQPQIRGNLEIPGVSEYLQLLNETTLLGIGHLEGQLQVSLFDVSNPDDPVQTDNFLAGGNGSSSPAFYDYKALAWLNSADNTTTRLALPASLRDNWEPQQQGLQLLTLDLNTREIKDNGFVTALTGFHQHYYGTERAIIDREIVHYSIGTALWTAPWSNLGAVKGPQAFVRDNSGGDESKFNEDDSR